MKVRVDKWIWAVRLFKSRTIATDACREGKVKVNGLPVKASFLIGEGEIVAIKKDGFNLQFKVLRLLEQRVGAPIAVTCYEDLTPVEERNKYNAWFLHGIPTAEKREKGAGRPTKKERRIMDKFKEGDEPESKL